MKKPDVLKYISLSSILLSGLIGGVPYGVRAGLTNNSKEALIDPFWIIAGDTASEKGIDFSVPLKDDIKLVHLENPILGISPIPRQRIPLEKGYENVFWELGGSPKTFFPQEPDSGTLAYTDYPDGIKKICGFFLNDNIEEITESANTKIDSIVIRQALGVKMKGVLLPEIPSNISPKQPSIVPSIVRLDLEGRNITDEGLQGVFNQQTYTELRDVILSGSKITDNGLKLLVEHCPNLQVLALESCQGITDAGLTNLRPLKITQLNLGRCSQLTNRGLEKMFEQPNFSDLEVIDLSSSKIIDNGLRILAEHCPHLEQLILDSCKDITNAGLANLEELSKLEVLSLKGCLQITKEGLKNLEKLGNLYTLDLNGCSITSEEEIRQFVRNCASSRLNIIRWNNHTYMGHDFVIMRETPERTQVLLEAADTKSDEDLKEKLGQSSENITRINLEYSEITDEGLKMLADHCHHLKNLSLQNCKGITNTGLQYLSDHCPDLKKLNLNTCKKITSLASLTELTKLITLCLENDTQIKVGFLIEELGKIPNLTNLYLGMRQIKGIGPAVLRYPELEKLLNACPKLNKLNLNNKIYTPRNKIQEFINSLKPTTEG